MTELSSEALCGRGHWIMQNVPTFLLYSNPRIIFLSHGFCAKVLPTLPETHDSQLVCVYSIYRITT